MNSAGKYQLRTALGHYAQYWEISATHSIGALRTVLGHITYAQHWSITHSTGSATHSIAALRKVLGHISYAQHWSITHSTGTYQLSTALEHYAQHWDIVATHSIGALRLQEHSHENGRDKNFHLKVK